MIESFEEIATGKWRIVYAEDYSTSFGFGLLLGEFTSGEVELGNDGSIASESLDVMDIIRSYTLPYGLTPF